MTPIWRTAHWTYLRFHSGRGMPRSCYGARELEAWAEPTRGDLETSGIGLRAFNNDASGCALRDASIFAHVLDRRGDSVATLPAVSNAVLVHPGAPGLPLSETMTRARAQAR